MCVPDFNEDGGTVYADDPSRSISSSPDPGSHSLFDGMAAVAFNVDGAGGSRYMSWDTRSPT